MSLSGPALTELLAAVLGTGVPFKFRAKGYSMRPFVRDGDVVTVDPLSNRSPGVGEVVAVVRPGTRKLLIHRIVGRKGASYLIKGDSAKAADGLVPRTSVLGRVTRLERNSKEVFLGLGPERHLIALLARPGLHLSVASAALKVFRRITRRFAA